MERVFYKDNGRIKSADCELVKKKPNVGVYHINNDNVKAIEYHSNDQENSNILLKNNNVRDIDILHFREKDYRYEQYIVGRGDHTNTSEFSLYGEINDFIEHEWDKTKIRFDESTVIVGNKKRKNAWVWIVRGTSKNKSITVDESGNLSDVYGGNKCVIVGSKEPIESIEVFKEIINI